MEAESAAGMAEAKATLTNASEVRKLGEMKDLLGLRVSREQIAGAFKVVKPGHTAALLTSLGMSGVLVTKISMAPGTAQTISASQFLTADKIYS